MIPNITAPKVIFLRTTYLLDMEKLYTMFIVAEQLKFYSTEKQLLFHTTYNLNYIE